LPASNTFGYLAAIRKEGKMAIPWISPISHPSEEFECLDCFLIGTLSVHGRCPRCDSNAVLPFMILENIGRWVKVNDTRFWVPNQPQYLNAAQDKSSAAEQPMYGRTSAKISTLAPAAKTRAA